MWLQATAYVFYKLSEGSQIIFCNFRQGDYVKARRFEVKQCRFWFSRGRDSLSSTNSSESGVEMARE